MTIIRDGKDVTHEIYALVEARQKGPEGKRQRDTLFRVLNKAIVAIEEIPAPWLDDCIHDTKVGLEKLRDAIPPS